MTLPTHTPTEQHILNDEPSAIAGQQPSPSAPGSTSFASWRSLLSGYSALSVGSLFSFASVFSIGSAGSVLSIGSSGSILSIGSTGSILSIGSTGCILAIGQRGAVGTRRRRWRARAIGIRLARKAVRVPIQMAVRRALKRRISQ